ncbi:Lrp/AsnC family transcriptional regulator, partial [bacterium]|nr:Lrp/AsnC family transcriptional regulator [bacterium]
MDALDRKLLDRLQADFPLTPRPYASLAEELGSDEEALIERVRALQQAGLVRRIGPVVDPAKAGRVGTLCAVSVRDERIEEVAAIVATRKAVTHNYERKPIHGSCPYDLWFTLTAASGDELDAAIADLAGDIGLPIVKLPTLRKFKIGGRFA